MNMLHHFPTRLIPILATIALIAPLTTSCGGKPEGGPGLCKLTCSTARISTNLRIKPISDTWNIDCSGGATQHTIPMIWKTVRKTDTFAGESSSSTSTSSDETTPMPQVSVEPLFPSSTGFQSVTPESNYCSDYCGVVKIEFAVTCPANLQSDTSATVDLHSGSTFAETPITVNFLAGTTTTR